MRPRFSLPVVALALTLAIVLGTAMFGFLAATTVPSATWSKPESAIAAMIGQVLAVVLLGSLFGVAGWIGLFLAKRDGWHRMESIAFLPFNYGGRSPFDAEIRSTRNS